MLKLEPSDGREWRWEINLVSSNSLAKLHLSKCDHAKSSTVRIERKRFEQDSSSERVVCLDGSKL